MKRGPKPDKSVKRHRRKPTLKAGPPDPKVGDRPKIYWNPRIDELFKFARERKPTLGLGEFVQRGGEALKDQSAAKAIQEEIAKLRESLSDSSYAVNPRKALSEQAARKFAEDLASHPIIAQHHHFTLYLIKLERALAAYGVPLPDKIDHDLIKSYEGHICGPWLDLQNAILNKPVPPAISNLEDLIPPKDLDLEAFFDVYPFWVGRAVAFVQVLEKASDIQEERAVIRAARRQQQELQELHRRGAPFFMLRDAFRRTVSFFKRSVTRVP